MTVELRQALGSGRIPPHNLEAEASVLGALMLDRSAIGKVADLLHPEDFYFPNHGQIFKAALGLYDRSEPIDLLTLSAELDRMRALERVGGQEFLATLESGVPTAANVEYYARIVEDAATKRRLSGAAERIGNLSFEEGMRADEAVDKAEGIIFSIAERRIKADFVSIKKVLHETWDEIEKTHADPSHVSGVPSGFSDLDAKTGGFQKANLIVVAARPGIGKTSLVLNIAQHAAIAHKIPVGIFSLEMSERELVTRLLCSEAGVDSYRLRMGLLKESEWTPIAKAMGALAEAPIFIEESPVLTVMEMRTRARRLMAAENVGLLIVDYLQLMQGRTQENRVQEISDISRSLKGLARELGIPVLACSQLSREPEKRPDHRPQLADLRESGCLSGETPVYLPDQGEYRPIKELVGQAGIRVLALNSENWKLEPGELSNAFSTGRKPVYRLRTQLGRTLRATANHRFLTIDGWRRLDEIRPGTRIALPRRLPGPQEPTIISGAGGNKERHQEAIVEYLAPRLANTNRDVIPSEVWRTLAVPAMQVAGITTREMQRAIGIAYCGTMLYKQNLGRERAARLASAVHSLELGALATSDVYWDRVASIEPDGEEDVYDLTVDGHHNFVAGDIVVHNSIEQDSDMVLFIYRDRFYNDNLPEEKRNIAEIIIAKHRNGPVGKIDLLFVDEQTKFVNLDKRR